MTFEKCAERWLSMLSVFTGTMKKVAAMRAFSARERRRVIGNDRALSSDEVAACAVRQLGDTDAHVRAAAVSVIGNCGARSCDVIEKVLWLTTHDSDLDVRARAVHVIAWMFARTGDARVRRALAFIVDDENEVENVRAQSYNGLFIVNGKSSREWPLVQSAGDLAVVFSRIDWSYVEREQKCG
jgi:hypothetical protein